MLLLMPRTTITSRQTAAAIESLGLQFAEYRFQAAMAAEILEKEALGPREGRAKEGETAPVKRGFTHAQAIAYLGIVAAGFRNRRRLPFAWALAGIVGLMLVAGLTLAFPTGHTYCET